MKRTILIYGLLAGAVVSLFMSTTMLITARGESIHTGASSMVIGYLGMLIAFAFIFVAIKSFRDGPSGGTISFAKAFGMGMGIAFLASTLYVATWAVVYHAFLPDYMEKYCAVMIAEARTSLSGVALQEKIDEINSAKAMYRTPMGFALFTYAEILPVGILVSLIAALVLKRKGPVVAVA